MTDNIDNDLFERDSGLWWSDDSHCSLLACLIPARLDYLKGIPERESRGYSDRVSVLDVGCGGGLFSEALASSGYRVTGVDISERSISAARRHAEETGLEIEYVVAPAEELPFADSSFDIVFCCDVLEHVKDVPATITESARVLRKNGVFMFDTVNRTWLSKVLMIKMVQHWLKIAPPDLHSWNRFIVPDELASILDERGLELRDVTGLMPDMSPIANLRRMRAFWKLRRGKITYAELGRDMTYYPSRMKFLNYMGYAVKL